MSDKKKFRTRHLPMRVEESKKNRYDRAKAKKEAKEDINDSFEVQQEVDRYYDELKKEYEENESK